MEDVEKFPRKPWFETPKGTLTAPRTESPLRCARVSAPRGSGGAMQMMHVSLNHVAAVTSPPSCKPPNRHVSELMIAETPYP